MVSSHKVVISYKPTVMLSENKAELHVQKHVHGAVSIGGKEPDGGHYFLVVDAIPLGKKKTKVDFYYGTIGNGLILQAVKGWATGENPGCPDLTKN